MKSTKTILMVLTIITFICFALNGRSMAVESANFKFLPTLVSAGGDTVSGGSYGMICALAQPGSGIVNSSNFEGMPGYISVLDIYGKQRNRVKPCLETPLHLEVLKARKNIGAVIHAHAPYATAFGNMKSKLKEKALEGNIKLHESLEKAVLAPHAKSGSQELARIVAEPFQRDDIHCVLMEGHGVTVVGTDIYRAYYHLDALEGRAKTFILTLLLYNGIR